MIPPNPVGIWAGFSTSKRGKSAPIPVPSPTRANVSVKTTTQARPVIDGSAFRIRLLTKMRNCPRITSGRASTNIFDQRKLFIETGELRSSQKLWPSRLTPGKTKRVEILAITKPARPRLRKLRMISRKNRGTGVRSSGSTEKL